jgi:hypothetical protein
MIRHGFLLTSHAVIDPFRPKACAASLRLQTSTISLNETDSAIGSTPKRWIRRLLSKITPQRRTIARRAFNLSHFSFTQNHKSP